MIEAAPELAGLLEACPNLTLLVTSRELLRVHRRGRVPGASARRARGRLPLLRASATRAERRDRRALRAPRLAPARGRARRRPHEGALSGPDPRAPLRTPRPAAGRPRRRPPPADPPSDDRVVVRPPLPKSSSSSLASRSSPAAAPSRPPRRSATPTSTPCSRSSRRAFCASRTSRYWMLETIREYALERLEAGGAADKLLRAAALEWFALLELRMRAPSQRRRPATLARAHRRRSGNLRVGTRLRWARSRWTWSFGWPGAVLDHSWLLAGVNSSKGRRLDRPGIDAPNRGFWSSAAKAPRWAIMIDLYQG